MPTVLQEFYQKTFSGPRKTLIANAPDYLKAEVSDKVIHAHMLKLQDLEGLETVYFKNILTEANKLPDRELRRIYRAFQSEPPAPGQLPASAGEAARKAYADQKRAYERYFEREDSFLKDIRTGNFSLFTPGAYEEKDAIPTERILGAFDSVLSPAAAQSIVNTKLTPPISHRNLPKETSWQPRQAELDALREKHTHTGDRTRDEANRRLLDRAGQILEDIKPEVLAAVDRDFQFNPRGGRSIDEIVEGRAGTLIAHGMELLDGTDRFRGIVAPDAKSYSGAPMFNPTESRFSRPLTAEDRQILDGLKNRKDFGLSQGTRDALHSIEADMRKLDYAATASTLLNTNLFPPYRPTKEGEKYLFTEQGTKYYAFIPVVEAKRAVDRAVQQGDLTALAAAVKDYNEVEKITDQMMKTLRSDKVSDEPFFSANMNSTRSSTAQLPTKYALDYVNHTKLNSLNILFASLQNANLSMDDLVADPMGTCLKLGEQFMKTGGLDSRPESIGAALQNGLKGKRLQDNNSILDSWGFQLFSLFRGVAGVAGLEKDPDRRAKFLAATHLGLVRATEQFRKERDLYDLEQQIVNSDTGAAQAMRGVIYQTAALAPAAGEKRFNLRALMEDFSKPRPTRPEGAGAPGPDEPQNIEKSKYPRPAEDRMWMSNTQKNNPDRNHKYSWWDGHAAVQAMVRDPGSVDFQALAGRNAAVIADAERERQLSGSFDSAFLPDLYLLHAWSAQRRLLDNAAESDRKKPGFEAFRQSVADTWKLAKRPGVKTALFLAENRDALDLLKQGRDWQPTLRDSGEYTDMKESLGELLDLRGLLKAGRAEDIETLYGNIAVKQLERAKADAFRYVRLKMKNGDKAFDSFVYQSGVGRAREGLELWRKLCRFQDSLGLRSPAQRVCDEAREALLLNRADPAWMREQGPQTLAKLLYADALLQTGMSPEEQTQNLEQIEDRSRLLADQLRAENSFWLKEKGITCALRQKDDFRAQADQWAEPLKTAYAKKTADAKLRQANQAFRRGYALDTACRELGFSDTSVLRSTENQYLQRKAEEILKRPAFREVMDRLSAGKTVEELKALHPLDQLFVGNSTDETPVRYQHAVQTLAYEKRCAALAAEASLRHGGKQPGRKEIDQLANALRKNESFQAFIQNKVRDLKPDDVENLTKALAKPDVQRQTLEEISQKVNQSQARPTPGKAAQPQAGPTPGKATQPQAGTKLNKPTPSQTGPKLSKPAPSQAGTKPGKASQPKEGLTPGKANQPKAGSKAGKAAQPQAGPKLSKPAPSQAGTKPGKASQPKEGPTPGKANQPKAGSKAGKAAQPQAESKPEKPDFKRQLKQKLTEQRTPGKN